MPVGAGAVNDKIGADWPEQNRIGSEVFALVADARHAPNGFKRIEQLCDPLIGGVNAVGGDILPNIVEVESRIGTENVIAHLRGFRRCSDLRRNLSRVAAGSTDSPRSRAARRRPSSSLNCASWAARAASFSSRRRRASRTTSLAELEHADSTFWRSN